MTRFEKECDRKFLTKYDKHGNLMREAENFGSTWVVWTYKYKDISGEYSNEIFEKEIKQYFK